MHITIDVLGLMGIAGLSAMLWCNIDGLDHVLFPTATGVRALAVIEPICENTIDWACHSRAIHVLLKIGRTYDTTMIVFDGDSTGLWALTRSTRCGANSCAHPIRHDAIHWAVYDLTGFFFIWGSIACLTSIRCRYSGRALAAGETWSTWFAAVCPFLPFSPNTVNRTEEGVARLCLIHWTLARRTAMICFNLDETLAVLHTSATGVRACPPALPRSEFAINRAGMCVTLDILHPSVFRWAFHTTISHLCQHNAFLFVQATTASGTAAIERLPT
jgi:hypothetical protein